MALDYPKLGTMRTVGEFCARLKELGIEVPVDLETIAAPDSPLAQPIQLFGRELPNRFAIQPMEGWDGTPEGLPGPNTIRRWKRFGEGGAALIAGGEAAAVCHEGRANPRQLVICESTVAALYGLREELLGAHRAACGAGSAPCVGLQLTHSGRFSRPDLGQRPEPRILYRHPLLDRRAGIDSDASLITDGEIAALIELFVCAARLAQRAGFDFVDLKHCHGYLGHEFLSAHTRPGPYGGSFENRTRFVRELAAGIRREAPGIEIAVRFSAFDSLPFQPDPEQSTPGRLGPGIAESACEAMPYRYGFGLDPDQPLELSLEEPIRFMELLRTLGVGFANITAGSPYYNPHLQRPALYPASDGYAPPEDPLIGVARQITVTRMLRDAVPGLPVLGSAFSYLQDFLPNVAQGLVREGWVDLIGLGRMALSYPQLPRDALAGRLNRKLFCRTFSDCTTAPRNGMVSGCYPLDPHYKRSAEAARLSAIKKQNG